MEQAREMVNLSKSITEKLRLKKGEITDDEVNILKIFIKFIFFEIIDGKIQIISFKFGSKRSSYEKCFWSRCCLF